jgi:C4-dicarboxylate-specific signal transduction histidine kinase
MVESSRLKGRAEVATNVLHNVGNVLNSVNISGNVLSERLQASKVSALGRVAGLLEDHRDDFAGFVANDERGAHIPELVCRIYEAIRDENSELIEEVDLITSHINHIKEIVAMQQTYAKAGGLVEEFRAEELVEDALKVKMAALAQHRVELIRNYEDTPSVQVDRHMVVQILINLLANAIQAIEEGGSEPRRICLRITENGGQFVRISVEDNGVGIAPENLNRIFSHGFTTKKLGHGFGLHSGAIAAQELGGALRVHSDGPGRGATFTIELPFSRGSAPHSQSEADFVV